MKKALYEVENREEEVEALQEFINSGDAWHLEGSVGRAAMKAIESGECILGEQGYHDFYGNYVPSRYEVKPGTKGSIEYAKHAQRLLPD
jgi:hypothetical protein